MEAPQILVVEDERLVAASLRKRLQSLGYEVPALAHSGGEAVQLAEQLRPHLVLMDIRLDGEMDGVTAAAEIRSRWRIPVVFLTAYSTKEVLDRAKVTEPYGYILKPYDERELHVVVETTLYKHRTEQALQASEQHLRTIISTTPECIKQIAPDGTLLEMNPAGLEMVEAESAEAVVGKSVYELIAPEHRGTYQKFNEAVCRGQGGRLEYEIIGLRGTRRIVETVAAPLPAPDGSLVQLAITQDTTERHRLQARYLQAQKMEAVGRLAGGVAHDFNNLLTVIIGYSHILLRKIPDQGEIRDLIAEVAKAGERAAALTQQLLAYSRKQILHPQVLSLNELLANMKKMLARMIGEDVTLTVTLAPDLHKVRADPGQIEQVMMNLCVNARDAMPTGGKLTIETRNVELDAGYAAGLFEVRPGSYVQIAVTDSGCGMDAQTQASIFEPFFTTKGLGVGTGLGLAMVYGTVKQSEGYIRVYSELMQGTTFKIYLPSLPDEAQPKAAEPGSGEIPGGTETILLVEDDDSVRALTRLLLQERGYTVLEASNGAQAQEIASRHQGSIDLLITDVIMPGMGGRQVADLVREKQPNIRVLFVSGYTDDAIVRHGVLESETTFLEKPFTMAGLAKKVREILDA